MASMRDLGLRLDQLVKSDAIKAHILKLPVFADGRNLSVTFELLSADEVRTLIDTSIKIEQARTGDVLTPTEYGNRFSGLEFDDASGAR